jgi:thiamine pyrophosphate-dependent acetolactate synthase large subunit-like protein
LPFLFNHLALKRQQNLGNFGDDRQMGGSLPPQTRYDLAAQGLGCEGMLIQDLLDLPEALESVANCPSPFCLNVLIFGAAAPQYASFSEFSSDV